MDETMLAEMQNLMKDVKDSMGDAISEEKVNEIVAGAIKSANIPVKQENENGFTFPVGSAEGVMERFNAFKQTEESTTKAKVWTSEYGKKFKDIGGFITAVAKKSALLEETKTIMSEGTPAQGGYLVPTEFNAEVIKLGQNASIGRSVANVLPMSSWKRTFPRQLTNVTIYWVDEAAAKTVTKPTFGQITQTCKVMAAIIMMTDELLRDSAINLQTFLGGLIAEAMALEEDRILFMGNTGAGDPFMGVRYAVGVINNPMAGASIIFDDLIDLRNAIAQGYDKNGIFITNRAGLVLIKKLKDNQGNYIWTRPVDGMPGLIDGQRYAISDQIVAIDGAQPVLYGDFKRYALLSPREGLVVKVSQDAYDSETGENAFMNDQTWLRFTKAISIDIALPAAFAYMDIK